MSFLDIVIILWHYHLVKTNYLHIIFCFIHSHPQYAGYFATTPAKMDFLTLTIGKQKNIALIAHDSKKHEMIDWCEANKEILKGHFLCGTGTTARMITEATGLPVKGYNSGPLGGDQQIGAKIVEGRIDFVVFFSDPLTAQPHDPDVKALLRIAQVYDIPIANNRATADFLISSPLMNETYDHRVINFHEAIADRAKKL